MPNPLHDTLLWFQKAVPEPQTKNLNVQTGVHFEEVVEMLAEMEGTDHHTRVMIYQAADYLSNLAEHLKTSNADLKFTLKDEVKFLDALCDQVVTATGVAHMHGFLFHGAMIEVNSSNFSKFVDGEPLFDENRKVKKGPDYRQANLEPFVKPQ